MSETDLKSEIFDMIEAQLRENPDVDNDTLREKAEAIDPSIKELNSRSFNARYPLQVKRKLAPPKPRKPRKPKAPKAPPEVKDAAPAPAPAAAPAVVAAQIPSPAAYDNAHLHIRETLLDLARDLSNNDPVNLINVISGIDDYVARIKEAFVS